MVVRALTLAQQKICAMHPSVIGISQETLATINSLQEERWLENQQQSLYGTHACPFAGVACRFMSVTCDAVTPVDNSGGGIEDDDEEGDLDAVELPAEVPKKQLGPLPILRVACLLSLDLKYIGLPKPNITEIDEALAKYDLVCDPKIEWVPHRVLTIKMQNLMECGLTEIGIATRDAEQIEKFTKIHTVGELLQLDWSSLQRFALPKDAGGIPNFGKGAVRDIEICLQRHGFSCPLGTKWVREQDTKEYIQRKMEKYMNRKPKG